MNFRQRNYEAMVSKGMPELLAALAASQKETTVHYDAAIKREKPSAILLGLFVWDTSPLGHEFWYEMSKDLERNNL